MGPARAFAGGIAIMDIDAARLAFGKDGKVDRLDVVTAEGAEPADVRQGIAAVLGPGLTVESPETQVEALHRMVESYEGLLRIFSVLALLVGLFVVGNAMAISVAERRWEVGSLRSLGATRTAVLGVFLAEVGLLGAVGSGAGLALGRGLASLLVGLVSRSMSANFYTPIDVSTIHFAPGAALQAFAVGLGTALVAGLVPAWLAARVDPLVALRPVEVRAEARAGRTAWVLRGVGVALLVGLLAAVKLKVSAFWPGVRVLTPLLAVGGTLLAGPGVVASLVRLLRRAALAFAPLARWPVLRLACDNLLRQPRRTASNVMSLLVGLVLVVTLASMQESFRATTASWLERTMQADLVVSSQGRLISFSVQPLHEDLAKELEAFPGLDRSGGRGAFGMRYVKVDYRGHTLALKAYDRPHPRLSNFGFDVRDRDPAEAGRELFESPVPAVLVSENFVLRFGIKTGDTLELDSPGGRLPLRVVGVVTEFTSPEGTLYLSREVYRRYWRDPLVTAFALYCEPGGDPAALRATIEDKLGQARGVVVATFGELRQQQGELIDESFSYTRAVEAAALLVGLLGLLNTLLVSVLERTRELGMLRSIGMSRRQVGAMILLEGLLQGVFGATAACLLGSYICYLWVMDSLASSVGWVLSFHMPWSAIGTTLLAGVLVGMIAGWVAARRAARMPITEALDYE